MSNPTCTTNAGSLTAAVSAAPAGGCGGATVATTYAQWYTFTAVTTAETITVGGLGSNLSAANTYVEILSGATCATLTSMQCQNVTTSMGVKGLTVGVIYTLRVYVTSIPPATNAGFTICVLNAPANDEDCGAIPPSLVENTTCTPMASSLDGATPSTDMPVGCASAGTHYDVWYSFNPTGTNESINISNLGSKFTNPEIELYNAGVGCGASLVPVACGTTTIIATSLTPGATYYIRISNVGSNPTGGGSFNICIFTNTPSVIDYSKSYLNITKGTAGGSVSPGDILEMRATFVIKTNSADSLSFIDTLYNLKGFNYIAGSLNLQTNEGTPYKNFTDNFDADAGWISTNGLDTIIHINFGPAADNYNRGVLTNTSKPSVFGSTCIILATYRVSVYAPYSTKINFKSGALTFRDAFTNVMNNITWPKDSLVVYQSPGLCPNAVSATNAIGVESNGTFGVPSNPAPLLRNRGTSTNTNYIYFPFTSAGNGPQDYDYGIANNTSGLFTTNQLLPKPSAAANRVFNLWDIIGDHTGATNLAKGNPPCDTTLPVSATNPCGYMMVVNSAYKADTVFRYTATSLCPQTYYEISAWFRNMCYKCSCDSNGVGPSSAGYIPMALNDSSGVRPNIAFDINGSDYYTTGDIPYGTLIQAGSDTVNTWVKKGFTYLTGPSETSIVLTLRNNAPGGGGNDWAIDDISIKNCLPNMKYSPSMNPSVCSGNPLTIKDTVQSFFNSYTSNIWQRSTDGGVTWTNVTVATTSTNALVGGNYQYITSYTIPVANTDTLNNNDKYRVVVGSTLANVGNLNCQQTDGLSQITLSVNKCGIPLNSQLLSFNGKLVDAHGQLSWTTLKEYETLEFFVEKSKDGINFYSVAALVGYHNSDETNYYYYNDPETVKEKVWYRIIMSNSTNNRKYSRTINLINNSSKFEMVNLINPFQNELFFDVSLSDDAKIDVLMSTLNGLPIKKQSFYGYGGINTLSLPNLESLTKGIYLLQIRNKEKTIIRKIIKN
ncbi:MAG: hypothetical protein NVS9B7_10660 [Flavisolibacter sp.]